jgi:hypothetical protein
MRGFRLAGEDAKKGADASRCGIFHGRFSALSDSASVDFSLLHFESLGLQGSSFKSPVQGFAKIL